MPAPAECNEFLDGRADRSRNSHSFVRQREGSRDNANRVLEVIERSGEVAGLTTHWREAPASGAAPILYVHGVPMASWDWLPYLERIGGVAPDLPGFGRSAKPADFDYSIDGYARWLEAFTAA